MRKSLIQLILILNVENGLYLIISLSVFIFVISFHPFTPQYIDYHQPLLFAFVIGVIVFLTIFFVRAVYPCIVKKDIPLKKKSIYSTVISGFIIWFLSSIVFLGYLFFVESLNITLYLVYKVALICLAPPIILVFYDKIMELRRRNELLSIQDKILKFKIDKLEERDLNKSIQFQSENGFENFSLGIKDALFIKSADNYVEIHYMDGKRMRKKLIRNTLKNIERQIQAYPYFLRSHRTCIININGVEKFNTNCKSHHLVMKGCPKQIPVSRQHVSKIKQALTNK